MVLHNLFFLVLTTAAYFSLIPLYEQLVTDTRAHQAAVSGHRSQRRRRQASQQSALNQRAGHDYFSSSASSIY